MEKDYRGTIEEVMMNVYYEGPSLPISQEIDKVKYRQEGETFHDKVMRMADSMSDNDEHS